MKKIFWVLSVILVTVIATGASADIRSDKCNAYSNDLGISAAIGSGCLTNVYLLEKDVKLPYKALLAGRYKGRLGKGNTYTKRTGRKG